MIRLPIARMAFLVALLALAGSLWLSLGMQLKACPLCLYQRTFIMGVVGVLGVGMLVASIDRRVLCLLALPLALAGFAVAVFHESLVIRGKLECPAGIMGLGSAPQQSLVILGLTFMLVAARVFRGDRAGLPARPAIIAAVALGVLFAIGAIASAPPIQTPTKPYETLLNADGCRPPFRG